jgi:hypothetical protein
MTKTASPQKDVASAMSNGKDGGTSTVTTTRQYQMARQHLHKDNAVATAEAILNRNGDGISAKTNVMVKLNGNDSIISAKAMPWCLRQDGIISTKATPWNLCKDG